jgi:hypothetical protein
LDADRAAAPPKARRRFDRMSATNEVGPGTDPDVQAGMILTVIARLASGAICAKPAE